MEQKRTATQLGAEHVVHEQGRTTEQQQKALNRKHAVTFPKRILEHKKREKTSKKAVITLKQEPLLKEELEHEEAFSCAQCDEVFAQKTELRKHTKLHHANPRYVYQL